MTESAAALLHLICIQFDVPLNTKLRFLNEQFFDIGGVLYFIIIVI